MGCTRTEKAPCTGGSSEGVSTSRAPKTQPAWGVGVGGEQARARCSCAGLKDASRWHPLARAPPRTRAPQPFRALLPGGTHMVPVAVRVEGDEEGRVVPAPHERVTHGAARLGEGAQLPRVGQRRGRQREERGRVGAGAGAAAPTARA